MIGGVLLFIESFFAVGFLLFESSSLLVFGLYLLWVMSLYPQWWALELLHDYFTY